MWDGLVTVMFEARVLETLWAWREKIADGMLRLTSSGLKALAATTEDRDRLHLDEGDEG